MTDFEIVRLVLLIVIPIVLLQIVMWITAFISIARKPDNLPTADKLMWVIIVAFGNLIGSILYFVIGSNYLDEKAARLRDEENNPATQ